MLLQMPLACFRTVVSVTKPIYRITPVTVVVLASFSPGSSSAHTNRVCAEGLHFSSFHWYGKYPTCPTTRYAYGYSLLCTTTMHLRYYRVVEYFRESAVADLVSRGQTFPFPSLVTQAFSLRKTTYA